MTNETKLPGRTVRGGMAVNCHKDTYRTLNRSWDFPDDSGELLGFRCVYPIDKEPLTGLRVLRGGSWSLSGTADFREHHRNWNNPGNRNINPGFRCVYLVKSND